METALNAVGLVISNSFSIFRMPEFKGVGPNAVAAHATQ
jgi:hypothetical protein